MEKLFFDINSRNVHYGDFVLKVRDMFARKQESMNKSDDKYFSKYWQVFAWSAILGFINDKRENNCELPHQSSFQYQMISNGSDLVSRALILMAIGKVNASSPSDILNSRKLLTIISEYAEGGAKYILEIRETPEFERMFDSHDDFLVEIGNRV